ncbi:lipid II:glycine glycyltransferase FemX [Bacillus massilinigeriensis]|uniref:lipid II:glycine glycyltransferase FemX n=1 Tax=Bacillus massilionigeriensis TaxID=1805475 RepID=UPI000A058B86|nr:GNAT family N-acetyltransferase [Bacillus massilionigeriensis]
MFETKEQYKIKKYQFIVLKGGDDWSSFTRMFSNLDIYYSKNYVSLFAEIQKGVPEAVFFENENGKVFYPFIKREIELKKGYFDIVTPYGYGGPILEGSPWLLKLFYKQFKKYALSQRIVTETVTFHPVLDNVKYMKNIMELEKIRMTTAVDLTPTLEEIRNNYSSQNIRNIKKAKREGVEIIQSTQQEEIKAFIEMYYETMDRNEASQFYYFPASYFFRQMEETDLSNTVLLLAKCNGEIIGGILFIYGKEYAHYHLGASRSDYLHLRVNNLLFDAMIELSKSLGLKALHLGGGKVEGDSLYKFKASFSNHNDYQYYLGKQIFNEETYRELIEISKINHLIPSQSNFFPAYRAPV